MQELAQQVLNGIALGGVYALFALGFSLVLANLRVFNVAHEAVFVAGAVFAYLLVGKLGWALLPGALIAVLLAACLNVGVYGVAVRHLQSRPDRELAGFISTLGVAIALTELAGIVLDHVAVRLPLDAFPVGAVRFLGLQLSSIQVLMLATLMVTFGLLYWLVERSRWGRQVRAVAYDRELAGLLGVNVELVTVSVFALSGGLAAVAAVLASIAFNVIEASMGASIGLIAIAVTVIGGFGRVLGTFLAALIVGIVASLTTAYLTTSLREVVIFGLMIAFLVWRPQGLLGESVQGLRA